MAYNLGGTEACCPESRFQEKIISAWQDCKLKSLENALKKQENLVTSLEKSSSVFKEQNQEEKRKVSVQVPAREWMPEQQR